jgi:hypothetical protein
MQESRITGPCCRIQPHLVGRKCRHTVVYFFACSRSAIVCMNAVFSILVRPWIKNTELRGFGFSIQRMISFSLLRVPGEHLGSGSRAAESCKAP